MASLPDFNVVALDKHGETYIVLFTRATRGEACRTLGRWASSPELSFTWYNAAVMSEKIRKLTDLNRGRFSA
jgi:hypothetical protein